MSKERPSDVTEPANRFWNTLTVIPLSNSPDPLKTRDEFNTKPSVVLIEFEPPSTSVVWYSIIALPLTLILPAFANVVAASVPANAVKPIFFKFVIFSPLLFIVITNSTFLEIFAYFTKVNDFYSVFIR